MNFSLSKSLEILERTPAVLTAMLSQLSDGWINCNEGADTWTPKEVVAHLIVCEETNWLPRIRLILSEQEDKAFVAMDMRAHFALAGVHSVEDLLFTFAARRATGLEVLRALNLQPSDFTRTGLHPVIGEVELQQIISTWATHDLTHIGQIARVMAKQNKDLTGGFKQYLKILN